MGGERYRLGRPRWAREITLTTMRLPAAAEEQRGSAAEAHARWLALGKPAHLLGGWRSSCRRAVGHDCGCKAGDALGTHCHPRILQRRTALPRRDPETVPRLSSGARERNALATDAQRGGTVMLAAWSAAHACASRALSHHPQDYSGLELMYTRV